MISATRFSPVEGVWAKARVTTTTLRTNTRHHLRAGTTFPPHLKTSRVRGGILNARRMNGRGNHTPPGLTRGGGRALYASRMDPFGAPIRRREDPRLITGSGRYVGDLAPPRLLHVAFVRSPHAHARLCGLDTTVAAAQAGVVAVVTGRDLLVAGGVRARSALP